MGCLWLGRSAHAVAQAPSTVSLPAASATPAGNNTLPLPTGDASPLILSQTSGEIGQSRSESLPPPTDTPTASPPPTASTSQYILEYNRSPVVGNRLRLEGVFPETRLGFTRPKHWKISRAQTLVRFQHSPALLPDQSFLTVRVNDTAVGSVALDNPSGQVTEALFEIPPALIQDFNDITLLAEQQTSETCTNPSDPMLWTEVLPDSKLILDYEPQPIALDFSQYPYPFLDPLAIDPNRLAYFKPNTPSNTWLTQVTQLQAMAGRLVDHRPLSTRLIHSLDGLQYNDGVMIVGTPAEQPILETLDLPFELDSGKWQDGEGQVIPNTVGILMMTALPAGNPVLVVTGNRPEGVTQATQALVQTPQRQLGTGQAILVQAVPSIPSPEPRDWPGYLPADNDFRLSQLTLWNGDAMPESMMVRGINPEPIQIGFRALPNDRFTRGNTMTLRYSYSPQINPRTSAVEVKLDGTTIAAKRLKARGGNHERFKLELPSQLLRPDSQLTVQFILHPRDNELCGLVTDDQLWGEIHGDTAFHLNRDISAKTPDLSLFRTGFPLTMPQDLSEAAIAIPDTPTDPELETLLALGERLGRLSKADSIKLVTHRASEISTDLKAQKHWVAIGLRDRFPFPELFQTNSFALNPQMTRQWQESQLQTLIDQQGVIQAVISPWNPERLVLALTSQTETGMAENRNLLQWDQLFYRLAGDTILLNRTQPDPSPFNPGDYNFTVLSRAKTTQLDQTTWVKHLLFWLQNNWLVVPAGIVLTAMLLYGISQLYLNRDDPSETAL
jgi:hypothetical protein